MRKLMATAFLLAAFSAHADPSPSISPGFLTGATYLNLPEASRRAYVTGLVEGFLLSSKFGARKGNGLWLEECIVGLGPRQLTPGIDRFVRLRSDRLHTPMHETGLLALQDICVRRADA